jgi:hypothetical protein
MGTTLKGALGLSDMIDQGFKSWWHLLVLPTLYDCSSLCFRAGAGDPFWMHQGESLAYLMTLYGCSRAFCSNSLLTLYDAAGVGLAAC